MSARSSAWRISLSFVVRSVVVIFIIGFAGYVLVVDVLGKFSRAAFGVGRAEVRAGFQMMLLELFRFGFIGRF